MPLGTEIGLGPGEIVLDGDPAPPRERGTTPLPTSQLMAIVAKRSPIVENTGRKKKSPKIAIWAPSHNFVGLSLRNYGTYRQSEKNLLSSNMSSTYPHNMVNFGLLAAQIG